MWAIEVIEGRKRRFVFPERFPFRVGRNGDLIANIPSELRFELIDGVLYVHGEDMEVNGIQAQRSILKRGDRVKSGGIVLKIERRWLAFLREGFVPFLTGLSLSLLFTLSLGKSWLNHGKVVRNFGAKCSEESRSLYERAMVEKKNVSLAMKKVRECSARTEDLKEKEEMMKILGQLSFLLNEEFRRLKFDAETAIRDGDLSKAMAILKQIRELSGDATDEVWRYATRRMREIVK